jgi:hypothetical protein
MQQNCSQPVRKIWKKEKYWETMTDQEMDNFIITLSETSGN